MFLWVFLFPSFSCICVCVAFPLSHCHGSWVPSSPPSSSLNLLSMSSSPLQYIHPYLCHKVVSLPLWCFTSPASLSVFIPTTTPYGLFKPVINTFISFCFRIISLLPSQPAPKPQLRYLFWPRCCLSFLTILTPSSYSVHLE